jgi:hypothetical protein
VLLDSNQRPRLHQFPRLAVASAGDDAIAWAESIGWDADEGRGFYDLDDWQRWCVRGILSEDPLARLCAFVAVLLVPRQNGKNVVLEVIELYALFVLDLPLILHSAHLAETSAEHMQRLWDAIESDDDLSSRCRRVVANGKESIYRTDAKCRIRFRTRSKKVGRGGSPRMVVFDEALYLTDQQIQAMLPSLSAQSARPDRPIIIYASSAPVEESVVLHRVRSAILAGDMPDAFLAEWSVELPAGDRFEALAAIVDDREALLSANPGMPARIDPEWIESTERPQMSAESYAIERLGVVFEVDSSEGVVPEARWLSLLDRSSQIVSHESWSLAVSPDRRWATFGVAGRRADGLVHVESMERQPGAIHTAILAAGVALFASLRKPIRIHKTGPEAAYIAPLREAGVEVVEVSSADVAQATGQFIDFANASQLRHIGQASLDIGLRGAVLRQTVDGSVLWSQRNSSTEITALQACTVALGGVPQEVAVAPLSQIW